MVCTTSGLRNDKMYVCIFHFHGYGTGGTLCGMENIRLLTGHSNHEQILNLGPYDARCWHYTNKSFK